MISAQAWRSVGMHGDTAVDVEAAVGLSLGRLFLLCLRFLSLLSNSTSTMTDIV